MIFLPRPAGDGTGTPASVSRALLPNRYDAIVITVLLACLVAIAHGSREMGQSLVVLDIAPVTLSPWDLPEYALRSTMRMFAAIIASLLFTFTVATLAAKAARPNC